MIKVRAFEPSTQFSVTLPLSLREAIDEERAKHDMSVKAVLAAGARLWLEQMRAARGSA